MLKSEKLIFWKLKIENLKFEVVVGMFIQTMIKNKGKK
jgi:hypothetical protein